jgi:hypothetical protein
VSPSSVLIYKAGAVTLVISNTPHPRHFHLAIDNRSLRPIMSCPFLCFGRRVRTTGAPPVPRTRQDCVRDANPSQPRLPAPLQAAFSYGRPAAI